MVMKVRVDYARLEIRMISKSVTGEMIDIVGYVEVE